MKFEWVRDATSAREWFDGLRTVRGETDDLPAALCRILPMKELPRIPSTWGPSLGRWRCVEICSFRISDSLWEVNATFEPIAG